MTPYLADPDVTLYHGDVLDTLREFPAESVDCVVTSPPYWGLRDYGTGEWEGGDAGCDHKQTTARHDGGRVNVDGFHGSAAADSDKGAMNYRDHCRKCGARRIDQQLGLEPTPEQYVERMVEVFREVRRVLAAHGTVWLNLGDSYAGSGKGGQSEEKRSENWQPTYPKLRTWTSPEGHEFTEVEPLRRWEKTKPKDLVGIPWRVAFALQADGWYLRSDIIWAKPNPMPESVTDRPTKAHEYVFLLSKQPRYFFDQEAVREPHNDKAGPVERFGNTGKNGGYQGGAVSDDVFVRPDLPKAPGGRVYHPAGRNIRSVWEIATQPYPEAHFATFPEELARRCIAAGCPENGTVLDPFVGSGTVPYVARKLGRHAVGIDLNESYLELAARRLQQQSLFAETAA